MHWIIYNMVVLVCLVTVGKSMSINCLRIKVSGASHHTAYNGIYVKTGDQCRGDTYRQRNNSKIGGDGLLVQTSGSDGWVVVANPHIETCPTTTDSNIRLIGKYEVDIPFLVLSVWAEFVNQKVMLNNELIVECDDIFTLVTCTNSSISSMQLCPLWGSTIKIEQAYYFTDGAPGKQPCHADNVLCKLNLTQEELTSLRSYCDGQRACLQWVVPTIRYRNCERNSDIHCDDTADTLDGLFMEYKCRRNRGCEDLRLVNTTYHSHFPSNYSQVEGVVCNERNVYSNGDYYLWYSSLSGVTEGWYFNQQTSSNGSFQCDGSVGTTVATANQVQYPEDAKVWYENPPETQDFSQTAAMVVCEERPLQKLTDPCRTPTTATTSATTVVDVQITTSDPVITVPNSMSDDATTITSNDATQTSQPIETDSSNILLIYTTTIYNDKSKMAEANVAVIAGAAAGGGGVVIIVVIIVAVLLIRRRKNKADPKMKTHDQEMVKSDTHDMGMEPGYAEVSPTGIVLENKTVETKLQSKLKMKGEKVKKSANKEQDSRTHKKTKKKKSMEDHVLNDQIKNEQTGAESPNDLYAVVNKAKKNVTQSEDDFEGDNDDVVIENTLYRQPDENDMIGQPNLLNRTVMDNDINDSGVQLDPDDMELDIEPSYAEVRNQSPVINTESVLTNAEKAKPTPPTSKFKNLFKKADNPKKQVEGKHKHDAKINDSNTEVGPHGDVYAVVQKPVKKQSETKTKPPLDDDDKDDVMIENTMYGAVEENVTPEAPNKHKGSKRNIVTMYADDVHIANDEEQEVDDS